MHERISIHQMCFAGAGLSDYVHQCRALGARRIGFISPALLAPGGLSEARAALTGGDIAVETVAHVFRAGHLSRERGEGGAGGEEFTAGERRVGHDEILVGRQGR